MSTSGREPDLLVDTSVAVPLTVADHEFHQPVLHALDGMVLGLAGHAVFETFSVLTRLPPPARRAPALVARLIAENFPESRYLSDRGSAWLATQLAGGEISGGAVYDALVGATACEHGLVLATNDRRAIDVYRHLGVTVQLVPGGGGS
ncbi:MAG: type II toxin-antitoxin system VapC family toxin [Acidimicrobiia bacterium]|nr:type II toxin-antitoxin system VapC family toxin [Acidimicrobiia bacterium]MCC5954369.1 type II toxin-antitoxin system VapC family toxin [Acidimicrobiia bacterium]